MTERILVPGADGFIGRHLVRALAYAASEVLAVSRRPADFGRGIESHVAEPRTADKFHRLFGRCDHVFHLASASKPGSTVGDPVGELECNLRPTLALPDVLQTRASKPLLSNSSGRTLYADSGEGAADKGAAISPRSYRGAGKATAELFSAAWCRQNGGNATALRPANVYGPGQTECDGFGIVPTCFGKMLRQEPLVVWGDGSAVRELLYIYDFVALCLSAITAPTPGWRVVNTTSGIGTSLSTPFETTEAAACQTLPRRYDATRTVDAAHVVIDPSRTLALYDWSARTSLAEGLARTWQWFNASRP